MAQAIPVEKLNDISVRFLLNLPEEELASINRVFFHLKCGYWWFIDNNTDFSRMAEKTFFREVLRYCSYLEPILENFDRHYAQFKNYMSKVSVYGAVLLNSRMNRVILQKSVYADKWDFPRGKIAQEETEVECASREVYEEVGVNIQGKIDTENYLTLSEKGKIIKLFVVQDISDTEFSTSTRNEVKEIRWHSINHLTKSINKKDYTWNFTKFLRKLCFWIAKRNPRALSPASLEWAHNSTLRNEITSNKKNGNSSIPEKQSQNTSYSTPKSDSKKSASKSERKRKAGYIPKAQKATKDKETFGEATVGWSVEEMFATNQNMGVKSTYSYDQYTTSLPPQETATRNTKNLELLLESVSEDKAAPVISIRTWY